MSELPTEEGWYWYRKSDQQEWSAVQVFRDDGMWYAAPWRVMPATWSAVENMQGHWVRLQTPSAAPASSPEAYAEWWQRSQLVSVQSPNAKPEKSLDELERGNYDQYLLAVKSLGAAPATVSREEKDFPLPQNWPPGLEQLTHYEFPCDDKGRNGGSWMRVMVAGDGDVHVSMQDWEDIGEEGSHPTPFPSVRCRTLAGGGRFTRTRLALLWLAQAIQLDQKARTVQK